MVLLVLMQEYLNSRFLHLFFFFSASFLDQKLHTDIPISRSLLNLFLSKIIKTLQRFIKSVQ